MGTVTRFYTIISKGDTSSDFPFASMDDKNLLEEFSSSKTECAPKEQNLSLKNCHLLRKEAGKHQMSE